MNHENNSVCHSCQNIVMQESLFCVHCGTPLTTITKLVNSGFGSSIERIKKELNERHQARLMRFQQGYQSLLKQSLKRPIHRIQDVAASDLSVELDVLDYFNYAFYHSGISQVQAMRITNKGNKKSQAITIAITLVDYGDSWEETIPSLAVGESWEERNITPPLSNKKLRNLKESVRGALKIQIYDQYQRLWSKTIDTRILAYNEWLFINSSKGLFYLPWFHTLATFIQPNATSLGSIIQKASMVLKRIWGDGGFSGYQSNDRNHVLNMLNAIHITLSEEKELGYINPPASFESAGQKIRLVEDTLKENRGTCLDLAVLQASLWERVGLSPQLVIIDGHAMMGCWLIPEKDRLDIPKVIDLHEKSETSEMMMKHLNDGDWLLINSTEITHDGSFDEAIESAYLNVAESKFFSVVDIFACRNNHILPLP